MMMTALARTRAVRIACLVAPLLLMAVSVAGHPKPAAVPYRWQLEFKPGDLRVWVNPRDDKPYWYFTYTVTNRTGQEQVWAPVFTMLTDAGEIMTSGENVPADVTSTLKALLANDLLETQTEVIGELLQGKEHAKDGLVIWPMPTTDLTDISIFVRGLSGETAKVKNPSTKKDVVLHKTLKRDYLIPGNALDRGSKAVELVSEQWIFR